MGRGDVTTHCLTNAQCEAIRTVAVADAAEFYAEYGKAFDVDNDAHVRWVFDAWFNSHRWVRALGAFASVREQGQGLFDYGDIIDGETARLARAASPVVT
jgi:hypothetical protein